MFIYIYVYAKPNSPNNDDGDDDECLSILPFIVKNKNNAKIKSGSRTFTQDDFLYEQNLLYLI